MPVNGLPVLDQANWSDAALGGFYQLADTLDRRALDVMQWSAPCDAARLDNVTCNAGSPNVTVTGAAFDAARDVGKWVIIYDVNAEAGGPPRQITAVTGPTAFTMSGNAGITCTGAGTSYLIVGRDSSAQIQQCLNDAAARLSIPPDLTGGPNASQGMGFVDVVVPPGQFGGAIIRNPLVVPPGVRFDTKGMLCNLMDDRYAPVLVMSRYTAGGHLRVQAAYGAGVQLGTQADQQATIDVDRITTWNVSRTTEATGAQRKCIALAIKGQDFRVGHFWTKNAAIGIDGDQASDFQILDAQIIGARQAIRLNASNQVRIVATLDTCGDDAGGVSGVVLSGECSDVDLDIQAFEVVGVAHKLDYVLDINPAAGAVSQNIRARVQAQRTGGGAVRLGYCRDLTVDLHASNSVAGATGGSNMTSGIAYSANVAGFCLVRAAVDENIATPYTGIPYGGLQVQRGTRSLRVPTGFSTAGPTYLALPNAAPTDAFLENGQIYWWINEATNQVIGRVRKSDGTYRTITLATT